MQDRNVRGTAASKVSFAREALTLLSTNHDMATFSGPEALKSYLAVVPTRAPDAEPQDDRQVSPAGVGHDPDRSAAARRARAGMDLEMVHLAPVGEIPVPSIVHLRSQHYSAIVGEKDGRYIVDGSGTGRAVAAHRRGDPR